MSSAAAHPDDGSPPPPSSPEAGLLSTSSGPLFLAGLGSDAIYRAIGESINFGVWVCGADGRNLYASESFLRLVGLTQAQCSDFGWSSVLHPDEAEKTIAAWKECVRTGGNWDVEHRIRGVDGRWYTILARGVPVKDAQGRIRCWAGINLDLTERNRTAAAFLESETRYRVLAETMLQGVVHQDFSGRIIAMNPAAERILGKSRERFLGSDSTREERDTIREDGTLFPGAEHPSVVALKTGREQRGVVMGVFNPQLQEYRWISIDAVPVFRDGGKTPAEVYAVFDDITDRKRAAAELKESENRFRHIADAVPVLIWITDREKQHTWFSRAWQEFTGRNMDERGNEIWLELIHPDDAAPSIQLYAAASEAGKSFEMEYRLRHRDGTYHWLLVHGTPRRDDKGTMLGYIGSGVDISERKRAEASSRASHQQLETVLASITDGLVVLDHEWRYTYCSEQAARIIGLRREDVLGQCMWDLFPASRTSKFHEGYHRAVATGQRVQFEEYYPAPLNKWLECHCYPSSTGLSVYFHDVTARKQAEATLRQNEALFSTLIEQAPLGVYVLNSQFRLHQVNSRALPSFASVGPLVGRDFSEVLRILWGPEVGGEIERIFRHTLGTGERYISPRFHHARHDIGEEQTYEWETQRVILPDGQFGVACYFRDVTESRRAEAALQDAKEAAELANATKDRFLAVLSHELRTPLTPVLMTVSALEHDPALLPEVRDDLAMIKRNIELETKLIDDLLDLSRITSSKVELNLEPLDLNAAILQVCAICRPQMLEKSIRLETHLSPAVGSISADPARLQQVFWNVLKNAVKFTPAHGTVRVRSTRLGPERCEVRIEDDGIGIPPVVLPLIFNAFEQGDARITRQFGGLGLGLAISRALVELHGGSIRGESAGAGQGATFIVELPGQNLSPPSPTRPAAKPRDPGTPRLRVLLVEDHADTARTLSRLLRSAGFDVVTSGDVASATAAAASETFDLLLSDLGLPDGDGHDVMRAVRAHRPIPGIAMSGYGMEEDIRRSTEAGFSEHLVKPVPFDQLVAAIRRVAENRLL